MELYPNTKRAIGPAIENGFYYDFEFECPITDDDLPKIEAKMRQILPTWDKFKRFEVSKSDALIEFGDNPYKVELINAFSDTNRSVIAIPHRLVQEKQSSSENRSLRVTRDDDSSDMNSDHILTVYQSGSYRDLCKGGHLETMKSVDPHAFKLTHLAGAYWRGDEKKPMLTRIYGLAFANKLELDQYLIMLAEAEKRDHRKLGVALDLFCFSDLVGAGLPLWTPKGTILRNLLDDFVWELRQNYGYEKVEIPHITKKELYVRSGHWEKFGDELFNIKTRENHHFVMKPMNCPHHTQIFKRKMWSYRELPVAYANTTMCYRDEQTGELNGLSRLRSFTQDDAHVFCRAEQASEQMSNVWEIVEQFYSTFGFDLAVRLSFWDAKTPEKYLGSAETWHKAQESIRKLAEEKQSDYIIAEGEAAFYGPKIDFLAKDSLGREWQVATIQLDMNLPERFDLSYVNEVGKSEPVVMIHAAIMGSIERFLSILIEHTAGAFPVWLAPEQVIILPISDKHHNYAETVVGTLLSRQIRVKMDGRNETLGKRIREAELQKIPYILVVGDKEVLDKTVAVRHYVDKDRGSIKLDQFTTNLIAEIAKKG